MHFDFTPKFCVHIVIAVTMLMALLRQITPYAIPNFATLPITLVMNNATVNEANAAIRNTISFHPVLLSAI